jgi:hypothetical protein
VIVAPDWCADVGKAFDPAAFIEGCRKARVADVEFYAKNALGHAFFPFRGRPCARDWVTPTRKLAARAGIGFRLYYNVGLDLAVAAEHPDWTCRDPQGNPRGYGRLGRWICLRSPWRDRVLDELAQLQEAVRPDGYWLDLFGTPNTYGEGSFDPARACHCERCREAWRARFGGELPAGSDDPAVRRAVYAFGQELRAESIRMALESLHALDPKLSLSYNHAGDFWDRVGVGDRGFNSRVTLNCMEAKPHAAQVFRAKALASQGKPFELMTYGCFHSMLPGLAKGTWVDWNLIPPAYLEVGGAATAAHGGRFIVGVNLPPDGTVRPGEFANLRRNFDALARREEWLEGLESVPDIAVVYDEHSEFLGRAAVPERSTVHEVRGLGEALLDGGMHYDVVRADGFDPSRYRAVVAGDWLCPDPAATAALRAFVEGGGLLLATNETSLWTAGGLRGERFAWADLLGVEAEGVSPHSAANFGALGKELGACGPGYPVLLAARALHVHATTARPLAHLMEPEAEVTDRTFLWSGPYNHPKTLTSRPFVTLNRVGKGFVAYLAGPVGRDILARNDPWLKAIVRAIVGRWSRGRALELEAPPGVMAVLSSKRAAPSARVLSLVNRYGGMIVGTGRAELDHPGLGPVRARLRLASLGGRPRRVRAIGAEGVKRTLTRTHLVVDVARIGHHALLLID